jgi:type I restriction enzyme, S subunit
VEETECPRGWRVESLTEIGLARTKKINPERHQAETFELYSVPAFSTGAPELVKGSEIASSRQLVQPGDVLLCKINPRINRVWVVQPSKHIRQIASTEWVVIRSVEHDPKFLMYQMRNESFRARLLQDVSGVGGSLMRARPASIRRLQLKIAPFDEQCRIVAQIEALCSKISRARSDMLRIAPLVTRLRQAMLTSAFEEIKETASWKPLASFAEHVTSGSRDWSKYYGRGNAVFVLAGNIKPLSFDPKPYQLVDPPREGSDVKRTLIKRHDLLITIVGANTGDVCRVDSEVQNYYVCQSVALVRLRDARDARFLELFFNSDKFGGAEIKERIYGQGRPHLSFADIKKLPAPMVEDHVRNSIVQRLDALLTSIKEWNDEANRGLSLLDRLQRAILTKAFDGDLVSAHIVKLGPNGSPNSTTVANTASEATDADENRGSRTGLVNATSSVRRTSQLRKQR